MRGNRYWRAAVSAGCFLSLLIVVFVLGKEARADSLAFDGVYVGNLQCADGGTPRPWSVQVRRGTVHFERGASVEKGFETADGSINEDGTFGLSSAMPADDKTRPLAFTGRIAEGTLVAQGQRGEAACCIEATRVPSSGVVAPFRPALDVLARRAVMGRPGKPMVCKTPPEALRDVGGVSRYDPADPSHSKIDPDADALNKAAAKPFEAYAREIARLGDAVISEGSHADASTCLAAWLDAWARGRAMLGTVTHQGAFERKWVLSVLSLNYVLIKDAPEIDPAVKTRIEAWLEDLAWATLPKYAAQEGEASDNNHLNWAILAEMATAVAVGSQPLFDWSIHVAQTRMLAEVAEDGAMPRELARQGLALSYHRFALQPMVLVAELAANNGIDLYARDQKALHRAVKYVRDGFADLSGFAAKVGVPQRLDDSTAGPNCFDWAEVYLSRFSDPVLEQSIRQARTTLAGKGLHNSRLGGNVTLRYGRPDL